MWSKIDDKSELCMDIITRKIDLVVMNFDRFLMPSNKELYTLFSSIFGNQLLYGTDILIPYMEDKFTIKYTFQN